MTRVWGIRWPASAWTTLLRAALVPLASWITPLAAQTCTFNPNQPNTGAFGTVNPSLNTTYTFSVVVNYKCTGNATASFTITGANDDGPGVYRMRNATESSQYMSYSISTVDTPGTKITINGQLVAAQYRNAWVGSYSDTLSVLILP
jgi:hypothetical protein